MFRFRVPVVGDSTPVVALAPSSGGDVAWEYGAIARPQALAWFFDCAFPRTDCCLRRLLQKVDVDFDSLNAKALEVALALYLDRLPRGESQSMSARERTLALCAALGATRVGLEHLRAVPPCRGVPGDCSNRRGRLQSSLAAMPSREAEIVILTDLFGHEPKELGVLLGAAEWRVVGCLERGRHRLLQHCATSRNSA